MIIIDKQFTRFHILWPQISFTRTTQTEKLTAKSFRSRLCTCWCGKSLWLKISKENKISLKREISVMNGLFFNDNLKTGTHLCLSGVTRCAVTGCTLSVRPTGSPWKTLGPCYPLALGLHSTLRSPPNAVTGCGSRRKSAFLRELRANIPP